MLIVLPALLAAMVAWAGSGGAPAVYVVGNLDDVSPGAGGILVLETEQAVFRSGKSALAIPYADIHRLELGTKVTPPSIPLYKVWQLHKRFLIERPTQRMVNFEFSGPNGKDQIMTLVLEESAADDTLAEIEIRQGKRLPPKRATNAESWWGDSAWRTTRNNNTVNPDQVGNSPAN